MDVTGAAPAAFAQGLHRMNRCSGLPSTQLRHSRSTHTQSGSQGVSCTRPDPYVVCRPRSSPSSASLFVGGEERGKRRLVAWKFSPSCIAGSSRTTRSRSQAFGDRRGYLLSVRGSIGQLRLHAAQLCVPCSGMGRRSAARCHTRSAGQQRAPPGQTSGRRQRLRAERQRQPEPR